jgi:hypothetical protein
MSGGISPNHEIALQQLIEWEAAGITDYMPVHIEFDEQVFIEENSSIRVHHIGVDDDLRQRDPAWFDAIQETADELLADEDVVLMVTCWVGCNRGPSATMAILLSCNSFCSTNRSDCLCSRCSCMVGTTQRRFTI